jgi:beta-N-acetylhexosaminidase
VATTAVAAGVVGMALQGPLGSDDPSAVGVQPATDDAPIEVCSRAAVADRAGLVLVVALPDVTDADDPLVDEVADVGVGGVMLRDDNLEDEDQARDLIDGLRARLGEHLLVAIDDEGGRVHAMGALGQSTTSARRLGQQGSEASYDAGLALGELAASIGVDWVLAPVADLDDGPASGVIGDRSFGVDPEEVARTAVAFARGVRAAGVAVTAKHFPGHGGSGDPHAGDAVDHAAIGDLAGDDLLPFDALISLGAEAVMVGHVTYPEAFGDLPASLEPAAYALLRARGFDGVVVTDALGMGAVHARFGFDTAPAMAIAAGADLALVNQGTEVRELHAGLVAAVQEGRLDEGRLDQAIARVLQLRGQTPVGVVCPA